VPRLLEAGDTLGGQLSRVYSPITDYPGIARIDGPGLAARFAEHLHGMGVDVQLGHRAMSVQVAPPRVFAGDDEIVEADAVILATGVRRRTLGLSEEPRLRGKGLSYTVSRDKHQVAGRVAVVIGGGDAAFEGATILAGSCRRVHLVHREPLSARLDFRETVHRQPSIRVHAGRTVEAILGDSWVEGVRLDDGTVLPCHGVFVRVGVEPRGAALCAELPLDERGYLQVDRWNRCAGSVYAVGDVCSPDTMSVSVAVGQAMIACKHIQLGWVR